MEPLSTAAIAIVSKLVMTEVAKAVLTGVKNQLQPDKMDRLLKNAIESAQRIKTFLHQYQDNPAIITSRPAGYRWDFFNLDEFPHYTLESFDDKQVATFIDHWYDSRLKDDPAQAERRKADLQKAFTRNERIRLLAKNPLLLTIITLIHRYQAELPRQRCKLYEKAVETLLTSWDSGKEIKLYSQVLLFLKSDDLLYILKKLAYWIHTQGSTGDEEGGTLIDKDELIRWLRKEIQTLKKCEAHEAKGEAERFIDFIQRRTGLLNEQGQDRYAFVHKTFQEYLTAEEIFDRADVEDDTEIILEHFRQHLHDQHWREVLLLLVSKLKGKKAQKAIQAVLDAGSEYEQWLHRDLLFAGWCLTEDPPELSVVAADWVGKILDRLVDLEVSDSDWVGEKVKHEVGKIIHCLGETTIKGDVWGKLRDRGSLVTSFRLLEFQASLGQESKAIYSLLSSLQHENGNVRAFAAEVLGKIGKSNPEIENGLRHLLNDEHWLARSIAATVLFQLGHVSPELLETLVSLFKNEHVFLHSIAEVLVQLRDFSSAVEQVLFLLLKDENWLLRSRAASTLGEFGNVSSATVESLLSLLKDEDSVVRSSAAAALSQSGNVSPDVVQVLLSSLEDENSFACSNAIKALGQLENASSVVVKSLLFLLKDENPFVCSLTASALIQLGNSSSELGKRLISLLKDETSHIRSSAAESLALLFKTSDSVLPEVVQWLEQNQDEEVMGGAIDCLWSIVVE